MFKNRPLIGPFYRPEAVCGDAGACGLCCARRLARALGGPTCLGNSERDSITNTIAAGLDNPALHRLDWTPLTTLLARIGLASWHL